jgi:hypothetical protein
MPLDERWPTQLLRRASSCSAMPDWRMLVTLRAALAPAIVPMRCQLSPVKSNEIYCG